MVSPRRDCNRQNEILSVCLFLRIGSIRTAIGIKGHGISVDLPYRIKCHALIGSVTASRLIVCRCRRTARCPPLESITVPRGDCRSQDQCDILSLCLTCGSVSAAVSVITDSVSFGDITPNGIKCHSCFVRVPFPRCIFRYRRIS